MAARHMAPGAKTLLGRDVQSDLEKGIRCQGETGFISFASSRAPHFRRIVATLSSWLSWLLNAVATALLFPGFSVIDLKNLTFVISMAIGVEKGTVEERILASWSSTRVVSSSSCKMTEYTRECWLGRKDLCVP